MANTSGWKADRKAQAKATARREIKITRKAKQAQA